MLVKFYYYYNYFYFSGKITTVQDPAGSKSLLKWKGVMFAPDDSNDNGDNTTKNDNFNGTVTKENKYKDCEVIIYY